LLDSYCPGLDEALGFGRLDHPARVTIEADGAVNLHGTCRGAGLGGNPYRDGSFEYYVSEPRRMNDMKGYGAFLRAAIELERSESEGEGRAP